MNHNPADDAYIADLKAAAANAPTALTRYNTARNTMEAAFVALGTTPNDLWIAAVSTLIAAHHETILAAASWDAHAEGIAAVHDKHHRTGASLTVQQAYTAAGIDATNWLICHFDAYDLGRETPLLKKAKQAIAEQRDHVGRVAHLTDPYRRSPLRTPLEGPHTS